MTFLPELMVLNNENVLLERCSTLRAMLNKLINYVSSLSAEKKSYKPTKNQKFENLKQH